MASELFKQQSEFTGKIGDLIKFAYSKGYSLSLGDAYAKAGHCLNSKHYSRLAVDLNLFKDGVYLDKTEDHKPLGEYWESIGGTWGGRFRRKDGNHYSWGEKG